MICSESGKWHILDLNAVSTSPFNFLFNNSALFFLYHVSHEMVQGRELIIPDEKKRKREIRATERYGVLIMTWSTDPLFSRSEPFLWFRVWTERCDGSSRKILFRIVRKFHSLEMQPLSTSAARVTFLVIWTGTKEKGGIIRAKPV